MMSIFDPSGGAPGLWAVWLLAIGGGAGIAAIALWFVLHLLDAIDREIAALFGVGGLWHAEVRRAPRPCADRPEDDAADNHGGIVSSETIGLTSGTVGSFAGPSAGPNTGEAGR